MGLDRERRLEDLIGLIIEHYEGECDCEEEYKDYGSMCLANRFISGSATMADVLNDLE